MRIQWLGVGLTVLLATLILLALLGPRPSVEPFTLSALALPENLDDWLSKEEAQVTSLRPGVEKGIVWAKPDHRKTALSLVYLHGFSASRGEISPVLENVSRRLGANVFFTRLRGHGCDEASLAKVQVREWLEDANEALNVAERIGEKTVLVGTSTGGTLALWAALQRPQLAGLVLLSPNFGPKDKRSAILLWPWGVHLVKKLVGTHRSWEPRNDLERRYWTYRYPIEALLPMMALVEHVGAMDLSRLRVPTLVLYSDKDQTLDVEIIKKKYETMGSPEKKILAVEEAAGHVIAGDAASPASSKKVASLIGEFLSGRNPDSKRAD